MTLLLGISIGALAYGMLLYGVHLLFVRSAERRVAAGAVFRRRVRQHALRQGRWS